MRLYRMELYKLFHRKIFLTGAVLTLALLLIYFWCVEVGGEIATVDGRYYEGYEAVQINRDITEEFNGPVTDETAADIIARYGFPHEVKEGYPGFRDANYLNGFVTDYLSDGYLRDWDDYRAPTTVIPVAKTDLGQAQQIIGKEIVLSYTTGWKVFFEMLQIGMVLASILILFAVSVVFSDEGQTKMLPLIFTTEEGKRQDIYAKIAAAFSLTVVVYLGVVWFNLLLCRLVFGLQGTDCLIGIVMSNLNPARVGTCMTIGAFLVIVLFLDLLAAVLLCAITLCVSAHFSNSFHAVAVSAVCWGAPVLVRMMFGGFAFLLMSGMPVFLIMTNNTFDMMVFGFGGMISVGIAVAVLVVCVVNGCRFYKKCE